MDADQTPSQADPRRAPGSPLWAVLPLAFLASLGTGVITFGIYFLAAFGKAGSYALGVVIGAAYVASALTASRTLRALRRRVPALTSRAVLGLILLAIGAICFLPLLAREGAHSWAVWIVALVYGHLTGMLWPLIEGFVSGGRSGRALRSATGQFNIWWASALVVAFVAMGPMVRDRPEAVLMWLGVAHLAALPLLLRMGPEPGRAGEVDREPHPPVYRRLLGVFRVQLPTSKMVIAALSPYLPLGVQMMRVDEDWQTPMVSLWMCAQVAAFVAMERWHAWHGRWWVTFAGGAWLLGGFAACLLAPAWAASGDPSESSGLPMAVFVGGLVCFGLGAGTIYTGALYYAMEVGEEEVASGGTHEALIGSGYLAGPLAGLGVAALVRTGALPEASFEATKLGVIGLACAVLGVIGWVLAWRGASARSA